MGFGNFVRRLLTWRSATFLVTCIFRAAASASMAIAVALLTVMPALAQATSGGDGGAANNGGISSATGNGADGTVGNQQSGGGGGGAGVTGGAGASDFTGNATGGYGGYGPGVRGGSGDNGGGSAGGGGGGGGAHGSVVTVDTTNAATITGGNGGLGGNTSASNRGGGGGGAGGYGVVVDGSGLTYTNNGTIGGGGGAAGGTNLISGPGGDGGDGGYGVYLTGPGTLNNTGTISGGAGGNGGATGGGRGGNGANGGVGVYFSGAATLINSGTITGGSAGRGGTGSIGQAGSDGLAAAGVGGGNLTIINSGSISGGVNFDGSNANAITFTGGVNSLTLLAGSTIAGNVLAFSSADTLALGGSTNASFDLSLIGFQYRGFGIFKKTGSSTWTLTGIGTTTTDWTVEGGTLKVGDSNSPTTTLMGNVTVDAAGTLAGHGTVTNDVTNIAGGIVAPGGSIGTLTVNGNYTQGSTSTLLIQVSPGAASRLVVNGNAQIAGTARFVYEPGVYSATTYNILSAANVSGTFSTISGTAPSGSSQSLAYSSTGVDLVLDAVTGTLVVAPTNDSVFTATGTSALLNGQQTNTSLLDRLSGLRDGSGNDVFQTAFASFGGAGAAQAFNSARPDEMNDNPLASLPQRMARIGGWFRGLGNFANLSGSAGVPGFSTSGGGFLAGIDRPVAPNLTAGIAGGYTRTNLSENGGSSGAIDSTRIALYGSYAFGAWALDASLGYAYDRFRNSRRIDSVGAVASSNHDGHEVNGALQVSRRFAIGGFNIAPAVGLQYVHLHERAFNETGAPGFNLSVSSRNSDSVRPFIGARAVKPWLTESGVRMTLEADVTYSRELSGTPPSLVQVGGGSFTVHGLTPSRDQIAVGTGLSATMSDRLSVFANYRATLPTGNLTQHNVKGGLVYAF